MSITVNDIIQLFKSRGRGEPPAALADIFVNPLVRVLNFLDNKLNLSNAEQTVDTIVALLEDQETIDAYALALNESGDTITRHLQSALDAIASNFGLIRRPAASSTGLISYYRNSDPSSLLPITIGAGRRIFSPVINQEYKVSSSITFNSVPPIDATTGKYYFTVPIASQNTGLNTVVGVGLITVTRDSIPGMDGAVNLSAVVGGRDKETDRELATRIKSSLAANNVGTKSGYENMILALADVKGIAVVGAGDTLMTRDRGDGGAIDIYVTDPQPITVNELVTSSNLTTDGVFYYIQPARQPVINDITAVSPQPDHIDKDLSEGNGGSVNAQDKFAYLSSPVIGSGYSFQANSLISTVQEYIDDASRKILGADVLVRESYVVDVDVVAQLVVLSGYVPSAVQTVAQAAIESFISTLNIGEDLEQSDVIRVVAEVAGVGRINIPMTRFNKTTEAVDEVNVIVAAANEVLRPNLVQFTS